MEDVQTLIWRRRQIDELLSKPCSEALRKALLAERARIAEWVPGTPEAEKP
jgi:hypothetical protein